MSENEKAAVKAAFEAHEAIQRAIDAYEKAAFGSHVTDPLRGALQDVAYSIKEATS